MLRVFEAWFDRMPLFISQILSALLVMLLALVAYQ